jgi:acetylserotonin N-methyltransferase
MTAKSFAPPDRDDRLLWDHWMTVHQYPVITVADEIGLFACLCAGPKTTQAIASELGVLTRPLDVVLGYLAALGLADREHGQDGQDGRWRATEDTFAWLDPTSGGYWGPLFAAFRHSDAVHRQILATLRLPVDFGNPDSAVHEWERGELPAERAEAIAGFMNSLAVSGAAALARQPLFGELSAMLDIGGGSGVFSIAAARAHPGLRATVLDIDTMCQVAETYIAASNVGERVDTAAVNMFTGKLPTGHDAHLYSNIFHDWSEETNLLLASRSFEALPSGGRILVHEMLVDDDGCGPLTTLSLSVLMLIGTRGRQYRFSELRAILEEAGFRDVEASETGSGYFSLVSGRKP